MSLIFAAISLGLLGSFHCVGMCGPIAMALPLDRSSYLKKSAGIVLYNIGRAMTYSVLGVLFGLIGQSFAIFGLQQVLSVALGILILVSVVIPTRLKPDIKFLQSFYAFINSLKHKISDLFARKSSASLFSIGVLNGLLPCGFVYLAIAGAVSSGSAVKCALFMAGFGFGTIPVMMMISWFAHLVSMKFRSRLSRAFPIVVSVMAILMILRGMNLGIPYVSPKMEAGSSKEVNCHNDKKICCHK
jgi:sulfite exporter TauE/SafE